MEQASPAQPGVATQAFQWRVAARSEAESRRGERVRALMVGRELEAWNGGYRGMNAGDAGRG